MNLSSSDEALLREYLLGILPEQDCNQIEQKLLSDDEFSKLVDLIEDEIIDEYIDESLDSREKSAVESYFLCPPARQKKLKLARLLRSGLQEKLPDLERSPRPRLWLRWETISAMAAALLVMVTLGFYTAKLLRTVETEGAHRRKVEAELAQERIRSENLAKEVALLRAQIEAADNIPRPVYYPLTLLPGTARSENDIPNFIPAPETKGLELHLFLVDLPQQPYHVAVQSASSGAELWSQKTISPTPNHELIFRIPRNRWSPGEYSIVITGSSGDPAPTITYSFQVLRTKATR